ncbi:hypothetical protein BV509_07240 [Rhodovulum sulfidophilum]|uniref:DUF4336 domain-containing protein n=1 Tax=Rhodovulum visakhapatnamense TaxID=364297 RepID=A0ABS1RKS6_9RHOB|nr:DUF4336 domain-containing protein [Rhodovulum visakhapatnamense]MBL3571787.1 DUF4336 domain-containing protein [Rhodovulum visakhapatnamense]MBL3580277.1 DUF4336 domain-containing protein [Rhodovulum visakhapatnamense]OLS44147.1 hypothetical protein BV509_07240 [Rhodovulum sulfidophilum]
MAGRADGLYPPLSVPKPLGQEIWVVDGPAIRFYGMPFPTRMCVVRLPSGGLWLHSPVRPDEDLIARIEALGPVAHLVAPNALHYAFLPAWAARFPEAAVHAAPGAAERAARHGLGFPDHAPLGPRAPEAWRGTIRQRLVPGHPFLKEAIFFHRPSRTLILTDLIEAFEPARLGPVMKLATWIGGIRSPGGTPRDARLTWTDTAAAAPVLREALSWAPDRVIMAHGAPIETDVAARLRQAVVWALGPEADARA